MSSTQNMDHDSKTKTAASTWRYAALIGAGGIAAALIFYFKPAKEAQAIAPVVVTRATEQAISADAFVDTIGVNTHIGWKNTPYVNNAALKTALVDLGVRHIRDSVTGIADDPAQTSFVQVLAKSGIHMQGLFDGNWYPAPVGSTPLSQTDVVSKVARLMPAIEIAEGPNETDLSKLFKYDGHGGFPQGSVHYDQDLYKALKSSPKTSHLPVLLGSVGNSSKFPQIAAITPGPVNYADYGNIHSYPGGKLADQGIDWCLKYANNVTAKKPMICGETGYHNNTTFIGPQIQPGVSEAAAGKYMPEVFFEMVNHGLKRSIAYELVDQHPDPDMKDGNGESHFGLLHNDWSPKPAYTALKNTIALLSEPGAHFKAKQLTYTLTAPGTVHHTLLQKSNGDFYLVLWNNVSCYNNSTSSLPGLDVTNEPVPATVEFSSEKSVTVFSPSDTSGTNPVTTYTMKTTPTSIALGIPDRVVILKIADSK